MLTREGVTRVVERAYAHEPSEVAWLEGIHEAAVHAFDGHLAVQVYTIQVASDGSHTLGARVGNELQNKNMAAAHAHATPEQIQALYLRGPVSRAGAVLADRGSGRSAAQFERHMQDSGALDVLGAIGMDTSGHACVLGYLVPRTKITTAERAALARLGGHLATAYRLRRGLGSTPPAPGEAVLGSDSRVLEAGASRDVPAELEALRKAVQSIDYARRGARQDPERALDHWKAMVSGQFTMVEHWDTDGRRYWIARENPPPVRAHHALSTAEQRVVALAAICRPSKSIAYELGFSPHVVSRLLASALRKLGLEHRGQLVEVHGAIVDGGEGSVGKP